MSKHKLLTIEELDNLGSLITIKGTNTCLGNLMHFDGKGTYDPSHGLVPVTKEQADLHNKCLDQAKLEGMDKNCEVGQGSYAYLNPKIGVVTFSGTKIADYTLSPSQTVVTFIRAGKTYRGTLKKNSDDFNFKRIA